ncbi:MAG: DMT family transporter [Chloroflexota bacterium]
MNSATLSIVFGLTSAAVWGAGDFSGGVATKRNNVYTVVFGGHLVGLVGFVLLAILTGESWPIGMDFLFGGLAGLGGMIGVLAFYSSLARSTMGVVAPVTAIVNAIIPLIFAFLLEGLPPLLQMIGILIALLAVWFLAGASGITRANVHEFALPALAGFGFAMFIVMIDRVSVGALYWPLAASRMASLLVVTTIILTGVVRGVAAGRGAGMARPTQLWLIALSGILDSGGNAFFALAAQTGRLDIASILTSLYPASTVFLAWLILGERLTNSQKGGVVLTLVALVLITL